LIADRHTSRRLAGARPLCDPFPVLRALLVAVLLLLTFDVSGLGALCGETTCEDPCPTDDAGGQCPPNCHACSGCSLPKVTRGGELLLATPEVHEQTWFESHDRPSSPEPADILDVPKPVLA
jgi:hypothetical protein